MFIDVFMVIASLFLAFMAAIGFAAVPEIQEGDPVGYRTQILLLKSMFALGFMASGGLLHIALIAMM